MQTKDQKKQLVAEVADQLSASKSVVFANFKSLTVKDVDGLKKELRKSGAKLQVLKKTLLNIALEQSGMDVNARKLEGQVAVIFSPDEVSAAKALADFAKPFKDHKIIVGGALGTKGLSVEEVKALAKLPTQDEMRAKLVGTLQAPISSFVRVLGGNVSGFVRVLQAVADKKAA
jgi:large subunit ribosomal protein L10